jgi:hypothetical protein
MTVEAPRHVHVRRYRDRETRQRAVRNYWWLASLGDPLRLPRLLFAQGLELGFEHVAGRHAEPGDLVGLANHLGWVHAAAYASELRHARLAVGFRTTSGCQIPGFLERRVAAVTRELGSVPGAAFTADQAVALLTAGCQGPAAFYKDANPRNFLITADGVVTVDFAELSLAPFGYDLAKLVASLVMTYGALAQPQIADALDAYNAAILAVPDLAPVTWDQLMAWVEIHHILTSRFLGRAGYRYSWHDLRPAGMGGG